ncbi:hypothetical protein L916_00245, partial [Phytophthora nicotianae]
WRILKQPLLVSVRHCKILISACIQLHNFCVSQRCPSAKSAPDQGVRSFIRDARSWNSERSFDYKRSCVELPRRQPCEQNLLCPKRNRSRNRMQSNNRVEAGIAEQGSEDQELRVLRVAEAHLQGKLTILVGGRGCDWLSCYVRTPTRQSRFTLRRRPTFSLTVRRGEK